MSIKIVCLVKQTLPTEAKIQPLDEGGIGDPRSKPILNPYDEFAVEEAVQWKESGAAQEVLLVSAGGKGIEDALRRGLAMGADRAVRIDPGEQDLDEAQVAKALAEVLRKMDFDLVLCGKRSIDSAAGEVPGRVAEMLGLPLLHVATKIKSGQGKVIVHRAADGGIVVMEANLPAIVSTDKSLNKPRYPNLPNIMKAKKKPMEVLNAADFLGGLGPTRRIIGYEWPPERGPVQMLEGTPEEAAKELADILVNEEKVIQ